MYKYAAIGGVRRAKDGCLDAFVKKQGNSRTYDNFDTAVLLILANSHRFFDIGQLHMMGDEQLPGNDTVLQQAQGNRIIKRGAGKAGP